MQVAAPHSPVLREQTQRQVDFGKIIEYTLQHAQIPTEALKALRAATAGVNREVCLSARRLSISDEFPLISLLPFANVRSLLVRGDFDSNSSNYALFDGDCPLDVQLHHLQQLSQLTHLRLEKTKHLTDAGLRQIGRLHRLQSLGLRHCPEISGEGLRHLAHLSCLERVDLGEQHPSAIAKCGVLDILSNLPKLQCVQFKRLSNCDLRALVRHPVGRKLKQCKCYGEAGALVQIARLENLQRLNISRTSRSDSRIISAFRGLRKLDKLHTLSVSPLVTHSLIQDALLDALADLPNLTGLDFGTLDRKFTPKLLQLTQLVDLTFQGELAAEIKPSLTAEELSSFPRLKNLKVVDIAIAAQPEWSKSSSLKALSLKFCQLSSGVLDGLQNLPNLTSLDFEGVKPTMQFTLRHLANLQFAAKISLRCRFGVYCPDFDSPPELELPDPLPNLTHLTLELEGLARGDFDFIARLPQLAEFQLREIKFDEKSLQALKAAKPVLRVAVTGAENPENAPDISISPSDFFNHYWAHR